MKTKTVWTMLYRPFTMGGNVNTPISTKVPVLEVKQIRGFTFFRFKTKLGTSKIAEDQTGGIIAGSFKELKKNLKGCTKKELQAQIDGASGDAKKAKKLTYDEFFEEYNY